MSSSLNLNWAFGFSKDKLGGVQSLCQRDRNALFFISSHSGVIYDFEQRSQTVLQGHCNIITCCIVDKSKRFIVTADAGADPIIIVWDAISCVPIKTFYNPHSLGIEAIDISDDSLFISTLSSCDNDQDIQQELAVWAWTGDETEPILRQQLNSDIYHTVKFNPSNAHELVTTGSKNVAYWSWDDFHLEYYIGVASKVDLGNFTGRFTTTIFLPSTENCISATSDGYVIVWETRNEIVSRKPSDISATAMKVATKALRLVECGITVMVATANDYLALACEDGAVRFYDFFLRLEAWFEDLSVGPITSLTFSVQPCPYAAGEGGAPGLKFWTPDFLVGSAEAFVVGVESALFEEVRKEDRRGTLLMQGMSDEVTAVACHPNQPLLAVTCGNGVLHVWNYEMKLLMILREFNKLDDRSSSSKASLAKSKTFLKSKCMSFDSSGNALVIAFTNGAVKVLKTDTLEDVCSFAPTTDAILDIKFSLSGMFFACYDAAHRVLIFKKVMDGYSSARKSDDSLIYQYLGRASAHTGPIVGIAFGMKDIQETLVSISEDRHCVEYDLSACSIAAGIVAAKSISPDGSPHASHQLELFAQPTAVFWNPRTEEDVEDRFIVANDEFKLKEYNIDSKLCRKTTIAPRFGTPPATLLQVPSGNGNFGYFAFAAKYRVIGMGTFPLTGDPSKVMGIVAHPGVISSLAISADGKFLFSAGGPDLSVNMWKVEPTFNRRLRTTESRSIDALSTTLSEGEFPKLPPPPSLIPFFSLLEGGEGGDLHHDIIDYFYYCQLRHLGEDTMDPRDLNGLIPLEEIPSLMRAIGYYPSEDEVVNMINEVRYKSFVRTGVTEQFINLEDFIKLYINHRPVLPLDKQNIAAAFEKIAARFPEREDFGNAYDGTVAWKGLRELLQGEGEQMSPADLDTFLVALIGSDSKSISDHMEYDAKLFSEQILGFEDTDPIEG